MSNIRQALRQAFDKFMTEGFEDALEKSTRAYYADEGIIAVQFCVDGSYKVLWLGQENDFQYLPPGILLRMPFLFENEIEYSEARDFFTRQFDQFLEDFFFCFMKKMFE